MMSTLCEEVEADAVEIEVMPDHVHLLVDVDLYTRWSKTC